MKKLIILVVLAVAGAAFFAFDLHNLLTFEGLKSSQAEFEQLKLDSPLLLMLGFSGLYVLVTALSLPGATIMTLAAGALFGLTWGTLIVSFASTTGATCAFLASRYVLRDSVQKKFGDRLKAINSGVEREGAFYLFTLRLVPIFPFFLINLLMGLTTIKTFTFFWVSQIGMFVGTVVYVNAGTQLAQLDSISGILSPGLIASFVLLGVFPLITKRLLDGIKKRRVYSKWTKPQKFDNNMIVIGGGAAGLVSSYIAAAVKAKVTLIESHKMGGDCLNYGCVPSKALIKSAKLAQQIKNADKYGLTPGVPQFSFKQVMARVHDIVAEVEPHDSVERYNSLGVEVEQGYATIVDPWTVEIKLNEGGTKRITAQSIVIAAGASPFVPPLPGLDDVGYLTSDTLWDDFAKRDVAPKRLIVLGGGPIGCELAQSFARLGSKVIQIEMLPRIMIREDSDVSAYAQSALENDGVEVLTSHKALRCERIGDEKIIIVEHDGKEIKIEFDDLICAVGRVARLQGYGLEKLGIHTERTVVTNDYLETLYPNIFAAGDVAGPYQFTHTAAHQAWYAAVNALFGGFKSSR